MNITVFLDLDDTIFQTRPKCPVGEAVWPAVLGRDGTPVSFMTDRQRALLAALFRTATVIPTTARSLDALQRVDLPFTHVRILDFGGVVLLPDGTLDKQWDDEIRPRTRASAADLRGALGLVERLAAERDLGVSVRLISDFDMPLYVVVKHPRGDISTLEPIEKLMRASADPARFFVHSNDNNLSLVPRFLGKERAVRYVMDHHLGIEPTLTIGVGDSLSDAPFLDLCDFSLLPRGSQLARRRLHSANLGGA